MSTQLDEDRRFRGPVAQPARHPGQPQLTSCTRSESQLRGQYNAAHWLQMTWSAGGLSSSRVAGREGQWRRGGCRPASNGGRGPRSSSCLGSQCMAQTRRAATSSHHTFEITAFPRKTLLPQRAGSHVTKACTLRQRARRWQHATLNDMRPRSNDSAGPTPQVLALSAFGGLPVRSARNLSRAGTRRADGRPRGAAEDRAGLVIGRHELQRVCMVRKGIRHQTKTSFVRLTISALRQRPWRCEGGEGGAELAYVHSNRGIRSRCLGDILCPCEVVDICETQEKSINAVCWR